METYYNWLVNLNVGKIEGYCRSPSYNKLCDDNETIKDNFILLLESSPLVLCAEYETTVKVRLFINKYANILKIKEHDQWYDLKYYSNNVKLNENNILLINQIIKTGRNIMKNIKQILQLINIRSDHYLLTMLAESIKLNNTYINLIKNESELSKLELEFISMFKSIKDKKDLIKSLKDSLT